MVHTGLGHLIVAGTWSIGETVVLLLFFGVLSALLLVAIVQITGWGVRAGTKIIDSEKAPPVGWITLVATVLVGAATGQVTSPEWQVVFGLLAAVAVGLIGLAWQKSWLLGVLAYAVILLAGLALLLGRTTVSADRRWLRDQTSGSWLVIACIALIAVATPTFVVAMRRRRFPQPL